MARQPAVAARSITPGRTRFRIQGLRFNAALAVALEKRLSRMKAVRSVTVDLAAGSLLVYFDAASTSSEKLQHALETGLPSSTTPAHQDGGRRPHATPNTRSASSRRPVDGGTAYATPTRRGAGAGGANGAATGSAPTGPVWHTLTVEQTADALDVTTGRGLSSEQASRLARKYGRNQVPDIPRRPRSAILKDQVISLPGIMLAAAAAFSALMGAVADAAFIGAAIVGNAAIGYLTEDYAERTIQSLRQTRAPHARVNRDGRRTKVAIEDVVPGDLLLLEPGHVVAADGRVVRSENLVMDESLLTGESEGRPKEPQPLKKANLPLGDRANMVYSGSAVASGKGAAIVTATGIHTELGRIRTLVAEAPDTPPPMSRDLQKLGGKLALLSALACFGLGVAGLLMGLPTLEVLAVSASLAVSAIPEGLPTVATTTLALGM
ncbi:MAG TPA: cation-transporting P-type ATPase, partial [Chthonomonadales bacterium]|nr:cation-transporting P-type ATPase [Chthonomonadales bacterium]